MWQSTAASAVGRKTLSSARTRPVMPVSTAKSGSSCVADGDPSKGIAFGLEDISLKKVGYVFRDTKRVQTIWAN